MAETKRIRAVVDPEVWAYALPQLCTRDQITQVMKITQAVFGDLAGAKANKVTLGIDAYSDPPVIEVEVSFAADADTDVVEKAEDAWYRETVFALPGKVAANFVLNAVFF